eukprot:COSAG05_NODE_6631_length_928_cov_1.310012_1_plen_169_part_00
MTTYQEHVKREMPKLRGQGLSAGEAMKELARIWRESVKHGVARGTAAQKRRNTPVPRIGGARASKRQSNAMLDELESLPVPKALPKGRAKRAKAETPIQIENCTDVESCKLQIRLLLQQQPPSWLKGNAEKVRDMVNLLREEDEVSSSIDAGKRKLGALDRQIMQLAI